jgi:hypothetical protein
MTRDKKSENGGKVIESPTARQHPERALLSPVPTVPRPRSFRGLRSGLPGSAKGRMSNSGNMCDLVAPLEVYTREQLPQDWAMTQNNLGLALVNQGLRSEGTTGAELLAQAVSAFRSALEVYTREQLPQNWSGTQNNLGLALYVEGLRSEGAEVTKLLDKAVAAYRSALEVFTREQMPQQWATTQCGDRSEIGLILPI